MFCITWPCSSNLWRHITSTKKWVKYGMFRQADMLPYDFRSKLPYWSMTSWVILRYVCLYNCKRTWCWHGGYWKIISKNNTTPAGFEPARAEPNRFQVCRLNHSAIVPIIMNFPKKNHYQRHIKIRTHPPISVTMKP